jgi:GNAT superfamily N-acetyltransferase
MSQLVGDYSYAFMSREELQPYIARLMPAAFAELQHLPPGYAYTEAEDAAVERLARGLAARIILAIGLFHHGDCVGWHVSNQLDAVTLEMTSTGVAPAHRRRGLYRALLPVVLSRARADGFQLVSSRHNLSNNAVIIPKLKAGFVISGFEVSDRFGTLARLSYLFNPVQRKVFDVRVGQKRLDDETRELLS